MCGIVGIIGNPNAAKEGYMGLLMLQHRGQDSAGILSFDQQSNRFYSEKNLGHISAAISESSLENLPGEMAIAHTRYSTIGKVKKEDIQPMTMNYPYGLAMVHNGNLINKEEIKQKLLHNNKRLTLTDNDLEIMMHLIADGLSQNPEALCFEDIKQSTREIFNIVKGGYSVLTILAGHGLVAFKDPNGLRPLVWGRKKVNHKYAYGFASESNALEFLGYEDIVELKPSELIFISNEGKIFQTILEEKTASPCMFEWIYFANADSTIWNKNVYQMRLKFGEILGERLKKESLNIDIVVPVPDTSRPSAITISEKLKRPYREVLIKNRYTQRTFILNKQADRDKMIKLKLNVVKEEVQGKNILLVDDSIVRGTTSKRIIQLLKDNGAAKVYIASTCPPIINPCFYGIDFPNKSELIAHLKNNEQIAQSIGAENVFYLTKTELEQAFDGLKTCLACVNGKYPTDITQANTMIETRIRHEETHLPGFC